ncbi:hypothetical protein ACFSUS_08385 [Spirosoma soli]|uniref:Uncharacterized protein n=1 Tax=Spirosoma soli TaxID=1770529 RepID=A0ABW5M0S1_9BACT
MLYSNANVVAIFQKRFYSSVLGQSIEAVSLAWRGHQGIDELSLNYIRQEQPAVVIISCEWLAQGADQFISSIRAASR